MTQKKKKSFVCPMVIVSPFAAADILAGSDPQGSETGGFETGGLNFGGDGGSGTTGGVTGGNFDWSNGQLGG